MPILKKCLVCGGAFKTSPSKNKKFCSVKCRGISERNQFTKNCIICKKEFITIPAHDAKCCSKECGYLSKLKVLIRNCILCHKEFKTHPSANKIYCSKTCSGFSRSKIIIKSCEVCNKEIRTVSSKNKIFCDQKCMGISKTTGFKDNKNIKQLTESMINSIDLDTVQTEFTDSEINDIFKLDMINALDIGDDVKIFSIKNESVSLK